jgi:ElaB/YqjD/DUF883 family membrane-anchored ribosome-binding protein
MTITKAVENLKNGNGNGAAAMNELDIEARLEEMRAEMTRLSEALTSLGSTKLDEYKAGIDKLAADAVSTSLSALKTAKSEAVSLEESFEGQIRSHPLQAIGIAAGIGFLAAIMTRRS